MKNKKSFFNKILSLHNFHYVNSKDYQIISDKLFKKKIKKIQDIPYIPTTLFKRIDLKSIPNKKVFKVLNSSGTSGSIPSKIFLDKSNAKKQTEVLNTVVKKILGNRRLPMLIIDEKKDIKNHKQFDAKTAAVIGFSLFGTDHHYLIKDGKIDYRILDMFLNKYKNEKFFIFGFTSYVYEHLIQKIRNSKNFSNGILIHGGGWKKMEKLKISNKNFKEKLNKKIGLKKIFNYYGLIEQTGSIFFECENCGCFSNSEFSDIIIRDSNLRVLNEYQPGYLQLFSILPKSYPGHSILTEDLAEIVKNDCSKCGEKKFKVHGRIEKSEARGCSDV